MNASTIEFQTAYGLAVQALCSADRTGNPETYELAAHYFITIGYESSAARCKEKAKWYQAAGHSPAEEEPNERQS